MINRDVLRNKNLSFQARGFLAYLLSHDKGWSIRQDYVLKSQSIGRDLFRSIVRELCEHGHMQIKYVQEPSGLQRMRYLVSEFPKLKKGSPEVGSPEVARPPVVEPPTKKEQEDTLLKKEQEKKTPLPPKRGSRSFKTEERRKWSLANEQNGQCGYSRAEADRYVIVSGTLVESHYYAKRDPFWEEKGL